MDSSSPETWICAVCGQENAGKFCSECGEAKGTSGEAAVRAKMKIDAGFSPMAAAMNAPAPGMPPGYLYGAVDASVRHDAPVVIHSWEIDVFSLTFTHRHRPAFLGAAGGEAAETYPAGYYVFKLVRDGDKARCLASFPENGGAKKAEFVAPVSALARLDALLKEHDVAQLDGYAYSTSTPISAVDLLVRYESGEKIAAHGPAPDAKYYREEWFIKFFRELVSVYGKSVYGTVHQ